jgi:glycosyltransferase involved in cell wall biosynthesis
VCFDGCLADELLPLAYRAADITLVPSAELEGFGLVAIESLAAGTPVLVAPIGGLPEVVSGLSGNMILQGADAKSVATGIMSALSDVAFLPDSEACRSYARSNFDWSVVTPQIAAIYREIL